MAIIKSDYKVDADEEHGRNEPEFKPLSAEEAHILVKANVALSPWKVLIWQIYVGSLVALAAWGLTGSSLAGWSAGYGALAVIVPAAFFIRGLARQQKAANAGSALVGFFVWEMVKIVLTVAMLLVAPRLIVQLNWLALLAGFVVTMKVYWMAMWLRPMRKDSLK
jgi:ATP synthase protein I